MGLFSKNASAVLEPPPLSPERGRILAAPLRRRTAPRPTPPLPRSKASVRRIFSR